MYIFRISVLLVYKKKKKKKERNLDFFCVKFKIIKINAKVYVNYCLQLSFLSFFNINFVLH